MRPMIKTLIDVGRDYEVPAGFYVPLTDVLAVMEERIESLESEIKNLTESLKKGSDSSGGMSIG